TMEAVANLDLQLAHVERATVVVAAECAGRCACLEVEAWRWLFCFDRHNAARRVAVQCRRRSPYDFNACGGGQIQICERRLAVRHCERNPVSDDAHTSHIKRRARAEAAKRESQAL